MKNPASIKLPRGKALYAIILGTLIAVGLIASTFFFGEEPQAQAIPEIVTKSTDDPAETPIPEDYVWQGKETEPKLISIPTIGVDGFIQKVTVDQRKEIAVPSNVNLAGWFKDMAIPGEKGLSIIAGHVDGRSEPGIFKKLEKLKIGQKFTVELGNGSKREFKVTSTKKTSVAEAPAILFSQDPQAVSQLNLITCGGTYDKKARRYLDRVIVTSVPV